MISLITCSRKSTIPASLEANIRETIGVPYEVIAVDNSENRYSIFEAYNLGASQAKYDLLCFMHDDILYQTDQWGRRLAAHLHNPSVGVVGVAGAVYKTAEDSPWWISNEGDFSRYCRYNLIQHFKSGARHMLAPASGGEADTADVVVLDGVWFSCRREIWERHPFDTSTYKGFHFYDLDFSLQAFVAGFRNKVCYDILIEHFSAGSLDGGWVQASALFHEKWKAVLPAASVELPEADIRTIRKAALADYVSVLNANKLFAPGRWFSHWMKGLWMEPLRKGSWQAVWQYTKGVIKSLG